MTYGPRCQTLIRSESREGSRGVQLAGLTKKTGWTVVKPARLHFARAARALAGREAFCPNIQPRAHARLTGLTSWTDI